MAGAEEAGALLEGTASLQRKCCSTQAAEVRPGIIDVAIVR